MLERIDAVDDLQGLARARGRAEESKTVNSKLVDEYLEQGWTVGKKNKTTTRLTRQKVHSTHFEDRVWTLLYKMRFSHLSGSGGAILTINPKNEASPKTQIDVVGIDDEIALAIECKSAEKPSRRPTFQEELGKHSLIRDQFAASVKTQWPLGHKRQVVLAMFVSNIQLSDNDRLRAKEANVVIFDKRDLSYYETLVGHLGSAAKYQFFSDMVPGKEVPGLRIRVPAIRFRMGGSFCYTFSVSPEYLLKICYVSHRSKGKASDVDAYQRMVSKSRLTKIKKHISDKGYFPTSIVVNLENRRVLFEKIEQQGDDDALLGWLEVRPAYKSAWIIDGQHRLFGYSGHERAAKSRLSVLAFAGLPPSQQARLFIEINSKQKKVPQILLQTLIAELNWDADADDVRLGAIISKAIQTLDADSGSVFYQRIQTSDDARDPLRCITITSLHSAIERTEFHIAKARQGTVIEYGPLWAGENMATMKRTTFTLDSWFRLIRDAAPDWWDKGANPGGGLAMNDGVSTSVSVLRSVFQHLETKGKKLIHLAADDLFEVVKKYGQALADYLGSLDEQGRKQFRELRGVQGVVARTRRCQKAIRDRFPDFNPDGLERFLELEKAQTNSRAKEIIDRVERTLQKVVLEELKREYGKEETEWWIEGVPKSVRLEVTKRYEEEDGKRGGKEHYFDLIHYRKIAIDNWDLFQSILGIGKSGKERGTSWMNELNEKRKIVSHASSGISLSLEDLTQLEDIEATLESRLAGREESVNSERQLAAEAVAE